MFEYNNGIIKAFKIKEFVRKGKDSSKCYTVVTLQNGSTSVAGTSSGIGTEFTNENLHNLTYYDNQLILESEASAGTYYFGYDTNNNIVLKKK